MPTDVRHGLSRRGAVNTFEADVMRRYNGYTSARHDPKFPAPRTSTFLDFLGVRAPYGMGEPAREASCVGDMVEK